jgi:hypothetical protein
MQQHTPPRLEFRGTCPALSGKALKRPPTHPGEVLLEEFLKPAGMTQAGADASTGILIRS